MQAREKGVLDHRDLSGIGGGGTGAHCRCSGRVRDGAAHRIGGDPGCYPEPVSLKEIQSEAMRLSDDERAVLAVALWESLNVQESTEEVSRRVRELEENSGEEISQEEFDRLIRESRGR